MITFFDEAHFTNVYFLLKKMNYFFYFLFFFDQNFAKNFLSHALSFVIFRLNYAFTYPILFGISMQVHAFPLNKKIIFLIIFCYCKHIIVLTFLVPFLFSDPKVLEFLQG